LIQSSPQKEFGNLTSTLNWPWNLEHTKKISKGAVFVYINNASNARQNARTKSEKQEPE